MKQKNKPFRYMRLYYLFVFLASLLLIMVAFSFHTFLSQFRSLGLIGIFLINLFASATVLVPAPGIASVVAGGVVYPPLLVALASSLGSSLGEMVGFVVGISGKQLFIRNHHFWYNVLKDVFRKYAFFVIFIFAFIPNPIFDVVGIIAGVFTYSPYRFFIALFLGRILRDIILASAGSMF